jgi:photosystem II stability/assembly factor-like uncharacterized protein
VRLRTLRLGVATALVVLTGAGSIATSVRAANPIPCNGNTELAGNGWLASNPGLPKLSLVRSVTYAPERIFATDGQALRRTDDGGCTWQTVTLPQVTVAGVAALPEAVGITDVATPSSSTSADYAYVAADATVTNALPVSLPSRPVVFASSNGGRSWTSSSNGLPSIGSISELAASDAQPRSLYALVSGAGSNSGIYVSNDAGSTWAVRSTDTSVSHLRVNPGVVNQIYGLRPGDGLVLSTDGGANFKALPLDGQDVQSFSAAAGSGYVQIAQGHSSSFRFDVSLDGGSTWRPHLAPERAQSVAIAAVVPVVAVYDAHKLSVEQLVGRGALHTPLTPGMGVPVAGSVQASAPTGVGLALTGIAPDRKHVLRTGYNMFTHKVITPTLTPIRLLPTVTVKQFPSTLTSAVATLRLPAGAHRDVPYQLLLPRTPSPVDLMFLVDTTSSTDQTIDGVRQGLQSVVNDLRSTGLDVDFGVADFKDYPGWTGGSGPDTDYPYKLRRRIGPPDASLQRALGDLKAADGGDQPESDLTALYQSTLGVGQKAADVYQSSGVPRWVVGPGQQAGYRPQSLRLAFIATDEPYHSEPEYMTPSWRSTVAALNSHGVHQIGLAVESNDDKGNPEPGRFDALPDERRMARDTGALAPPGGVDCDGNGTTDIAAGQPLVCTISKPADKRLKVPVGSRQIDVGNAPAAVHLAPLLVQLAESIPDYRSVGLHISGGPAALGKVVSNPAAPSVNIRADNTLGYVVRYTCPRLPKAHTWPLTLTATAGARALTSTTTAVSCGPVAKVPPAAAVAPPAAAAVVAAGVAPVTPPNPPTNVNSNVNPNPAVNPNAGFAQQNEEQPQLALADADQGLQEDTSLAMSRRTSDRDTALMLAAAGLMTAAAAGYATRSRWRTARQHN